MKKSKLRRFLSLVLALAIGLAPFLSQAGEVRAADLTGGSVSLSDSRPSGTSVSYTIDFDNVTTSTIKCIKVEFDSQADGGGGKPTGMNIASATFGETSDYIPTPGSWGISSNDTSGVSSITYETGEIPASSSDRTVVLSGITNGSVADTGYFVILSTYNNIDCASSPVDDGIATYIYTGGQSVSLTVDPSISFMVAAVDSGQTVNGATTTVTTTTSTIPLGTVTESANAIGAHTLTVTTNAGSGFYVYTRYSGKPTSGSNDIDDHTGDHTTPTTMSAATEAFGYTTDDTANYSQFNSNKWAKFTSANEEVMKGTGPVSSDSNKIGYQVGVAATTPAGSYTTTVILTCTPNY